MARAPDPTPEQIALACAAIRAKWSDAERLRRCVYRAPPWQLPEVPCPEFMRNFDPGEYPTAPSYLASYANMTRGHR